MASTGASLAAPAASRAPIKRNSKRLGTAWARYEVRPCALQAEHIREHQHTDAHRIGVLNYLDPGPDVHLKLQKTLDDDRLLGGAVPQPEDWLRAWRASRTPQSYQAAASTIGTEHFIRASRARSVQRRPLAHMARIIREAIRQEKRRVLATSTCISLSLDDRKGYKLVRYRAALLAGPAASQAGPAASGDSAAGPAAAQGSSLAHYFVEGILGCVQCLHGASLDDLADDYALRTCREVLALLQRFCTPEGENVKSDVLYNHVLAKVRSVVADGALQKVGQYLKSEYMPNIVLIARDPAHMIRIACKEPLVRTSGFEEQNERLFGKKTGILRKIQFSDGMQARLQECQKKVLLHRGTQGGDVEKVMRHFSFAPQRFESWTGPRRKYVCCMHAIALLLAEMAGDSRRQQWERSLAEQSLKAMTCQNLIEVGLAADFGEICTRCSEGIRLRSSAF